MNFFVVQQQFLLVILGSGIHHFDDSNLFLAQRYKFGTCSVPFAGLFVGLKLAAKCPANGLAKKIAPRKSKPRLLNPGSWTGKICQGFLPEI